MDMLKVKDGNFFISDWLRNRNIVEFLGIWEERNNPKSYYGEFAIIKSHAGLNSNRYYRIACPALLYTRISRSVTSYAMPLTMTLKWRISS